MGKLLDFLTENPVDDVKAEIVLGGRLKDFTFGIKAIDGQQFARYQKLSSKITKGKTLEFDSAKFNELLIINHVTEPNFRDAEAIKKAGCISPEQFMYKALLSGEIAELAKQISSLSGFDKTVEEEVEEAKNS